MKNNYGKIPKNTSIKEIHETLSEKNKKLIKQFIDFKRGSVVDTRLTLLFNSLVKFANLLELDFDKATRDEITMAWNKIYSSKEIADKSKQDEHIHIRQAFKYWFGDNDEYPRVVKDMKKPKIRQRLRIPKKMPTEEEIRQAIKFCRNSRDKFFVAYLGLDGLTRPIELRLLKWGKLEKDKNGYYFNVWVAKQSGKLEERPIRIIHAEPEFVKWMHEYPGKTKGNNYVFCDLNDPTKPMTKGAVTNLFKRLRKLLGLEKFSSYVLRHATVDRLMKDPTISEALKKKLIGHSEKSTVSAEYTHVRNDEMLNAQSMRAGNVEIKVDSSYRLKKSPLKCPHCKKANPYDAEICGFCNFALNQRRQVEAEIIKEKLKVMEKKFEKEIAHKNNDQSILEGRNKKLSEEFGIVKHTNEYLSKQVGEIKGQLDSMFQGKDFMKLFSSLARKQDAMSKVLEGISGKEFDVVVSN